MNLEQIVKETVAKMVDEKHLTAAETKKKEDIVKAMKGKGLPEPVMYAIATDKAKKLAEASIPSNVESLANKIISWYEKHPNPKMQADRLPAVEKNIEYLMSKTVGNNAWDFETFEKTVKSKYPLVFKESQEINEDYEVAMAQDSLDSIIRAAMMLKTQMGDNEVNLPAWIQDHITNSENYINQAAKGYHESDAQMDDKAGAEEMDEANLGHNEISRIEQEGRFWIVTYNTADGTKEKSFESEDEARKFYNGLDESQESNDNKIEKYEKYTYTLDGNIVKPEITFLNNILKAMLGNKIYNIGAPENGKVELTPESGKKGTYEVFQPKSSFDDYKIGDNVTVAGKKAKITNMKMDDESGERRARVKFEDGTAKEVSINTIDENTMITNEGRSAEDIKQGQLDQAYAHLEKIKDKPRLFTSDDIKKAEARIEKLEAELDALAAKATNESLDEATVRRWQHYAGIK
jgi:hypothetical protein